MPVIAVLSAGMAAVYLDGFNGKEVYSDQLFKGFKDFENCRRYVLEKAMDFHLVLSSDCRSVYRYFKVLCIHSHRIYLMKKNLINLAPRHTQKINAGYKRLQTSNVLCKFIPNLLIYAVVTILALLSKIPFVGILFAVITVIVQLVYIVCTVVLRSCTHEFL